MTTKRSSRRRLLTADLLYSSLLIVLVYVTMLNGFVYDAYWSEIECAFGLLDQLQPKELGLAISDADYYDWGLSVCDASSLFLTSWSGLSFYAISILILLLHLLPLLFVRSRYLYLITFALDTCYWGIYLYAFGWGAVCHPFYGFFPAICLVPASFLLMLGVRLSQYKVLFRAA
ncbi:hypothetical protein [Porphyromonas sp.]